MLYLRMENGNFRKNTNRKLQNISKYNEKCLYYENMHFIATN